MALLPLFLMGLLSYADGLRAYNCEADVRHIATYSVDLEPNCDSIGIQNVTTRNVQILQKRRLVDAQVLRCMVSFSYVIYHCGFDSIAYLATSQLDGEVLDIDSDNCLSAVQRGYFTTPFGDKKISGLVVGSEGVYNVDLMGHSQPSGRCRSAAFNFRGTYYGNHVMKGTFRITITSENLSVDRENDLIFLGSGLEVAFSLGTFFDSRYGNFFWQIQEPNCLSESFDVLHEGPANVTSISDGERILTIEAGDFILSAKLETDVRACGYVAFETSIEGILVVFQSEGVYQFSKTTVDPRNIDVFRHLNAKLGYLFSKETASDNTVFLKVARDICFLEYRQTRIAIEILIAFPDAHVVLPGMPKGSIAKIMGEVVYVYQCLPVQVDSSVFDQCIQEIPVLYENKTMFMRPFSRILTTEYSVVPCSDEMAPTFYLGGSWRSYSPGPGPAPTPEPLLFGLRNYSKSFDWTSVEKGLYPRKSLTQLQKIFTFGQRKNGIISKTAQGSYGSNNDEVYSIVRSLTSSDWESLRTSFWSILMPFERIGSWVSIILGIIAVVNVVQYVVMAVWRFVRSPREAGCFRRMALALSGSIFLWWHAAKLSKEAKFVDKKTSHDAIESTGSPHPPPYVPDFVC